MCRKWARKILSLKMTAKTDLYCTSSPNVYWWHMFRGMFSGQTTHIIKQGSDHHENMMSIYDNVSHIFHQNMHCGISLELPEQGDSNEPQCVFQWKHMKKYHKSSSVTLSYLKPPIKPFWRMFIFQRETIVIVLIFVVTNVQDFTVWVTFTSIWFRRF